MDDKAVCGAQRVRAKLWIQAAHHRVTQEKQLQENAH